MLHLAYTEKYFYQLPEGHKFPINKYLLVQEQLTYEGTIQPEQLYDPGLVSESLIKKVHTADYWERVKSHSLSPREVRKIGLPITPISVKRARSSVAGTLQSALYALEFGAGINLAGGTHHAYPDRGEGFSVLNDIAITAHYLMDKGLVKKILIVDLDVHQGNGNAHIFRHDPRVFTFSMHGKDNYPLKKEQSDLDIALKTNTSDELYLGILSDTLPRLIDQVEPEIIFYQSGVDVLATDKLGKLGLTRSGCRQRDVIVAEHCQRHQIPLVVTMGGGYSPRMVDIVEAHCNTMREAVKYFG